MDEQDPNPFMPYLVSLTPYLAIEAQRTKILRQFIISKRVKTR